MHSLWEFPVLTLKYGGVVFILVYLTMFLILGAPMLLLEMTLGQYGGMAPTKMFRNICPVRKNIEKLLQIQNSLHGSKIKIPTLVIFSTSTSFFFSTSLFYPPSYIFVNCSDIVILQLVLHR